MRPLAAGAALLVLLAGPAGAHIVSCPGTPDPELGALQEQVLKDPHAVLRTAGSHIAELRSAPWSPPRDHALAGWYAVAGTADSVLELDRDARRAAEQGLPLVPDERDPLHLILVLARALNVYDSPGLEREAPALEHLRDVQPPGSRAQLCMKLGLGMVQIRRERADLAVAELSEVYHATDSPQLRQQHSDAAEAMSTLMRNFGEYGQALALNQEVLDWDQGSGHAVNLSVAHFLRGEILREMGKPRESLREYSEGRRLALQIDDTQGVGFNDLRTCEAQIALGQLASARQQCDNALRTFQASATIDMFKETQGAMASIDLAESRPDRALALLDRVLEHGGVEMPVWRIGAVYRLRARANEELGHAKEALSDYQTYMRHYFTENDALRGQQTLALRARFETDRAIEHNKALQRELELAREVAERQRTQLRWVAVASTAGALVIALLTYILFINQRHRRDLERMAREDALTGLPNRASTATRARAALDAAIERQQPLTLALLDMDNFKGINDAHGHAAGDYVLQQFAQRSRDCLRGSDLLGRWGGEEFLLLLPETTLDTALGIVERLRNVALEVRLPDRDVAVRVSISAGLATTAEGVGSLDELIARADSALYDAKDAGRDGVRVADESYRNASSGVRRALAQGGARIAG